MRKVLSLCAIVVVASGAMFVSWTAEQVHNAKNQVMAYQKVDVRPALTIATVEQQGLEKVPNVESLRYYESIRKIGPSLWGKKRVTTSKDSQTTNKIEVKREEKQVLGTEKRQGNITDTSKLKTIDPTAKKIDKAPIKNDSTVVQCIKDAIDKKDSALKTALATHNTAILAAVDARNACQKSFLDQLTSGAQKNENKTCANNYQTTLRTSLATLNSSKSANIKSFRDSIKACKPTSTQGLPVEDGEMNMNVNNL